MKNISMNIDLPEGIFNIPVTIPDKYTSGELKQMYFTWRKLCDMSTKYGGRNINLPEIISEVGFCLNMPNTVRVNNVKGVKAATSFDCYNFVTKKRIQVKACSIIPDLTSFGPASVWDELYFCDFYMNGDWDGRFKIFKIEPEWIYSHQINSQMTFLEQQADKRRPRFSIYSKIIREQELQPIKIGRLF